MTPSREIRIPPLTLASTSWLRLDRLMLLSRYDCGALPFAVFNIVKQLETELAWREHAKLLIGPEGGGVIHDTHDCSRDGTRCVYGYFSLPS